MSGQRRFCICLICPGSGVNALTGSMREMMNDDDNEWQGDQICLHAHSRPMPLCRIRKGR